MEHSPDHIKPCDVKKFDRRNWAALDDMIDETLRDYDAAAVVRRPGQIGGVACRPSFELPDHDHTHLTELPEL